MPQKSKKLVAVLVTSTLMTEKTEEELEQVSYILYFITFKDWTEVLLDSESEVNAIG